MPLHSVVTADLGLPLQPALKISFPRVPAAQISRARLLDRLEAADQTQLVLVSAPAGHGKTQLLAEWAASRPDRTAWVTIDATDNDDRRLWSVIIQALEGCPAVPDDMALVDGGLPASPSLDADFIAHFTDTVRTLPVPVTLVLDDVHEQTAAAPLAGLAALHTYGAPGLQVVLSGRSDPPLRLERLRVSDRLCELRAADLAFSTGETGDLLERAGLTLRADQVDLLIDQTEGWAAGVRLAALAMRQSGPSTVLTDLVGNTHAISDYLVREVISALKPEARDLLETTCICTQLTAPLAQQLSGQSDAGEVLGLLEQENSLVTSVGEGRRWFRVHPLLRSHLLAQIRRYRPDQETDLHRCASTWFEVNGDRTLAVRHAVLAADPALAERLLAEHAVALIASGDSPVIRMAHRICPEVFLHNSRLAYALAHAQLEVVEIAQAQATVKRAGASWPDHPDAELISLRQLVENQLRWLRGSRLESMVLPAAPPPDGSSSGAMVLAAMGAGVVAAVEGRADDCSALARKVIARGRADGNRHLTARGMSLLVVAAAVRGDLVDMSEWAARTTRLADPMHWRGTSEEALIAQFLAQAALLRGQPDECLRLLQPASKLLAVMVGKDEPTVHSNPLAGWISQLVAVARFDRGDRATALTDLTVVRSEFQIRTMLPALLAAHAVLEYDCASDLNRPDLTHEVVEWAEQCIPEAGELCYLRARGPAKISRFPAAQAHLRPLLDGRSAPLTPTVIIDAWLLESAIRLQVGDRERSISALRTALTRAGALQAFRPLIRAPEALARLMAEQLGGWAENEETVNRVLERRRSWTRTSPVLTRREQEVLNLLPSLRSLEEIAMDLTVSLNTVKTHVRSIYGKLGVQSRRQAVQTARGQGFLLPTT